MTFPIDAVITWVDGRDPRHAAKRARFAPKARVVDADAETRFADIGEIYLCIAGILKFAPFVRRIWIVSDDQSPLHLDLFVQQGLCEPDRIRVVDHRTIFAGHEDVLPVFNSMSVETMLWRIPDLAEHYIYFNDDFCLTAPHQPADFFENGVPRIHARRVRQKPSLLTRMRRRWRAWKGGKDGLQRVSAWGWQMNSARVLGNHDTYLRVPHVPAPLRVSTQRDYYGRNPDVLAAQIVHRLRGASQFVPVTLAYELELQMCKGQPLEPHSEEGYFDPKQTAAVSRFLKAVERGSMSHACLQSLDTLDDSALAELRVAMINMLSSHLPDGLPLLGGTVCK